jgi:selenocysteine lyase/cysteine desulfurase
LRREHARATIAALNDPIRAADDARHLFPAAEHAAYFDTAAVGLASRAQIDAVHDYVDDWAEHGLDWRRGEAAAENARTSFAALIGTDRSNVALIPSVSTAAGFVAAQFGPARPRQSVVIGAREYSSNHYPWRMLATKGYDVRQVPFRNGGVEPDEVASRVDAGTVLVACSGVQSSTGHRSDLAAIGAVAHAVDAQFFVDGSQLVGAASVVDDLGHIDLLATSDHKFLMNAGRGLGYCYLSPAAQDRAIPINAGWKAGRVPVESFYGPTMDLSPTASRFDTSISWVAAIGNETALSTFDDGGAPAIYARNRALTDALRASLAEAGWTPIDLPEPNRSTIVAVPLGDTEAEPLLAELRQRGIRGSARDGNLRLSVHFYNHEDDVEQLTTALRDLRRPPAQ